jgi:hypothetical protein
MKRVWLIAVLIFAWACALPWTGDPRIALTDWTPPRGTISYVELASRFAPWKRSAFGLSCGSDHQLRLVLRSRLPGPRWVFKQGNTDTATIFIRGIDHKLEVPITLTEKGVVDTLISEPLSRPQLQSVMASLGPVVPQKLDVMTMETGTYMKGRANSLAVQKVAEACE